MDGDAVGHRMVASVAIGGYQTVGSIGIWGNSECGVVPYCPMRCLVQYQGVGRRVVAAVRWSIDAGGGWWEDKGDVLLEGIDACATGNGGDQGYGVGAFGLIYSRCMIGVASATVAEAPPSGLYALACSDRSRAVHRDGAVVVEGNFKPAVADHYGTVEQRQGEASAGEGAHCEVTRVVVNEREVAVVGDVVV